MAKISLKEERSDALQREAEKEAIVKRVKRAHGQLGAVVRMLEEARSCEEIVIQMAAVGKAVNTAAFTLIALNLKECLLEGAKDSAAIELKLQKLFLTLA